MIPHVRSTEPAYFHAEIAIPGRKFVADFYAQHGRYPQNSEWRDYWDRCRKDLYDRAHGICAYTGLRINWSHSTPNVEHYYPKGVFPDLAYVWDNYRLLSPKVNSTKKDKTHLIDPADLDPGDVILEIPSLSMRANPNITSPSKKLSIEHTISELKLNRPDHIKDRFVYICQLAFDTPKGNVAVLAPILYETWTFDQDKFDRFIAFIRSQYTSISICQSTDWMQAI